MADGFVHTVHANGRWTNTIEGDHQTSLAAFDTKTRNVEGAAVEPHAF